MGLDIIRFIQSFASPFWDRLFVFFTILGEEIVVAAIFAYIYWCIDKEKGKMLGYLMIASICVNTMIKDILKVARPIGESGVISKRVETAPGYSFPSNHTQNAAVLWTAIALWARKSWVSAFAVLMVLAIGFSRIYLGVHYPTDVLGGLLVGLCLTLGLYRLKRSVHFYKLLFLCAALMMLLSFLISSRHLLIYAAAFIIYRACNKLEERFIRFTIPRSPRKKLRRFLTGIFLILLAELCFYFLPGDYSWIKYLRYVCDAAIVLLGYPWLFKRLNL